MDKGNKVSFLLYRNDRGVVCGEPSKHLSQKATLYEGIWRMEDISLRASIFVPYLLCPDELPGSGADYSKTQIVGTKAIDGIVCYEIAPIGRGAYFIDPKLFLVREITTRTFDGKGITITYHPAVDAPLSQSSFQIYHGAK